MYLLQINVIGVNTRELYNDLLNELTDFSPAKMTYPFMVSRPVESRADWELAAQVKRTLKNNRN
jgi:hypothetical protein